MLPIEQENFYPVTYFSTIQRRAAEEAVMSLIGEPGSEGTATALKALQLIRALPPLTLDRERAEYLLRQTKDFEGIELPKATEGVYDRLCKVKMPGCICISCRRNHTDGMQICCVEHGHGCRDAACPDYERKEI